MEISRENFRVMIFYDYKCNLTPKQASIDFIWLLGMKHHPIGLFIIGLPNSSADVPFLVMNSVKVVHPRLLLTLIDAWNDWARPAYNIPRDSGILRHWKQYIRFCMITWAYGNFAIVGSHIILPKLKNRLVLKGAKKFNRGRSSLVYNIVTGDETWIYSYEPESKQQSTVWVFQNEPKPTKVVRSRSAAK